MFINRFKSIFSTSSRQRGEEYFRRGSVSSLTQLANQIEATVQGTSPYQVRFSWTQPTRDVRCSCACPHFDSGFFCKHLWAALLAVEDQKPASTFPSQNPKLYLIHEKGGSDPKTFRSAPPKNAPRKNKPGWQAQLDFIAMEMESEVRPQGNPNRHQELFPPGAEIWFGLSRPDAGHKNPEIHFYKRTRLSSGEFATLKPLLLGPNVWNNLPESEKAILAPLVGSRPLGENFAAFEATRSTSLSMLSTLNQVSILQSLISTNRFGMRPEEGKPVTELSPLTWDEDGPWNFELSFDKAEKGWLPVGQLVRGKEVLETKDLQYVYDTGLLLHSGNKLGLIVYSRENIAWLKRLRERALPVVAEQDLHPFCQRLMEIPAVPPLSLPKAFPYKFVLGEPTPVVQFISNQYPSQSQNKFHGHLNFQYETPTSPKHMILANREKEAAALMELYQFPVHRQGWSAPTEFEIHEKNFTAVIKGLLDKNWRVELQGKPFRRIAHFEIEVKSGIDWLDLKVCAKGDTKAFDFEALRSALKAKEPFVLLSDGSQALISDEWAKRLTGLYELGETTETGLRFKQSQGMLLNTLLDSKTAEVKRDSLFSKWVKQVEEVDAIKSVTPGKLFHGKLRPYQKKGLGWLKYLKNLELNGCLADDMGLGKTIQVLAHIVENLGENPSLVVAPKSLVFNWISEAKKFAPSLRVMEYSGANRDKTLTMFKDHDLIVTTYGAVRTDIEFLANQEFHYCILDESQNIKNAAAQASQAARLLKSKYRLCLTGTPIENHLGELWAQFEFLNPGMLGSSQALRALSDGDSEEREALGQALRPFLLRRTKEEVIKDLPPKTEQYLYCEFDHEERVRYDTLREYYRKSLEDKVGELGISKSQIYILEGLLRLRQAACDYRLVDDTQVLSSGAKLRELVPMLQEILGRGHKALIFSQFTSFLALLRTELDQTGISYEYLDGGTTDRKARVERFQNTDECSVFLLSLKAGGVGLNLTRADYVFLLDPWWNPAVESQAIDRAHRIGQKNPVVVYRLVVKDTIEEKVLALQDQKKTLVKSVLGDEKGVVKALSAQDLKVLFSA